MKKFLLFTGVAILVFGVFVFGASFILPIKTSAEWYTKVSGINLIGVLTILASQYEKLKLLLPNFSLTKSFYTKTRSAPTTTIQAISNSFKDEDNKPNIQLKPHVTRDYECIHYLLRRCDAMQSDSKTSGIQACSILNDLFFKDYNNNETKISSSNSTS